MHSGIAINPPLEKLVLIFILGMFVGREFYTRAIDGRKEH